MSLFSRTQEHSCLKLWALKMLLCTAVKQTEIQTPEKPGFLGACGSKGILLDLDACRLIHKDGV